MKEKRDFTNIEREIIIEIRSLGIEETIGFVKCSRAAVGELLKYWKSSEMVRFSVHVVVITYW